MILSICHLPLFKMPVKLGNVVRVTVLPASGKLGNGKVFTAFVSAVLVYIYIFKYPSGPGWSFYSSWAQTEAQWTYVSSVRKKLEQQAYVELVLTIPHSTKRGYYFVYYYFQTPDSIINIFFRSRTWDPLRKKHTSVFSARHKGATMSTQLSKTSQLYSLEKLRTFCQSHVLTDVGIFILKFDCVQSLVQWMTSPPSPPQWMTRSPHLHQWMTRSPHLHQWMTRSPPPPPVDDQPPPSGWPGRPSSTNGWPGPPTSTTGWPDPPHLHQWITRPPPPNRWPGPPTSTSG